MLKKSLFPIIFTLVLFICLILFFNSSKTSTIPGSLESPPLEASSELTPGLTDSYLEVLDMIYNYEPSFNEGIKYLALDTSTLVSLSSKDKELLLEGLSTYGLEVLDYPFEDLQQLGYIEDLLFKDGIFFQIETTYIGNDQIAMIPSKWRSTTDFVGLSKVLLEEVDNHFVIIEVGSWWHH